MRSVWTSHLWTVHRWLVRTVCTHRGQCEQVIYELLHSVFTLRSVWTSHLWTDCTLCSWDLSVWTSHLWTVALCHEVSVNKSSMNCWLCWGQWTSHLWTVAWGQQVIYELLLCMRSVWTSHLWTVAHWDQCEQVHRWLVHTDLIGHTATVHRWLVHTDLIHTATVSVNKSSMNLLHCVYEVSVNKSSMNCCTLTWGQCEQVHRSWSMNKS